MSKQEANKKTSDKPIGEKVSQNTVNQAVWKACDTFRGVVDASVYKDYVLTLLFVKYLSDVWQDHYEQYQKEYGDHPELIKEMLANERFVLPAKASFYQLYKDRHLPGNGERIDKALHAIEEANISKLADVFQDISFNSNKLGEEKQKNEILQHLLENFAQDELNLRPSRVGSLDIIGNAYEFLIKNFAASSGKKAGEFYTPPEVSELMARIMQPQEGEEICDPACGSASLLLKCANQVRNSNNKPSRKFALFGQEAIGSTWALAKMNMFLHGVDNHKIEWGDTIRNPKLLVAGKNGKSELKLFDVVVANPPFSLDQWGHGNAETDPYGRFKRGIPPQTKGDYAFILHMIETLKPATAKSKGGRMAVVVPHGVLFRGSSEGKIRKQLIDEGLLDAVIGLPEKLFYGTGIPAAILIFRKDHHSVTSFVIPSAAEGSCSSKSSEKTVLFIDASHEFTAGKNQNMLAEENLQKIISTYQSREAIKKYSHLATLKEIQENDYNLNIPRYVDTFEEEQEIDLMMVRQEGLELKKQLEKLEKEMEGYLKELGYGD